MIAACNYLVAIASLESFSYSFPPRIHAAELTFGGVGVNESKGKYGRPFDRDTYLLRRILV